MLMLAPKLASTRLAKLTASLVELSPEEFEKVLENPYKYAYDNHELSDMQISYFLLLCLAD